jgi:hypothetical protein
MYRPYRDFPPIDEPMVMVAKRRYQDLDREIAAACLYRQAQARRAALPVWLFAQARRAWHGLWVRIRKSVQVTGARAGGLGRLAGIELGGSVRVSGGIDHERDGAVLASVQE